MTELLIIGAGYTGKILADRALQEHANITAVRGTSRDQETLDALDAMGARGVRFDLLEDDADALSAHITPSTWVVYSAPTLYKSYESASEPGAPARHVAPVRAVLEQAARQGARGFIYLSSTSVYGDHDGEVVDEESAREPTSPFGKMRAEIEDEVLQGSHGEHIDHLIVARIVGIYGPGRTLAEYIAKGRYKLVDGGKKVTNRVHVEDIARAILAMIERAPAGANAYNVCDGDPRSVRELVDEVCALTETPYPEEVSLEQLASERGENVASRWRNSYRCSNAKLVEELDWSPLYPNALAGYRAILGGDQT